MRHGMTAAILAMTGGLASACSAEDRSGGTIGTNSGDSVMEGSAAIGTAQGMRATVDKRIVIASARGEVTVELVDNGATQALLAMLPLTIEMRDHLRQEKTGPLPSPLPEQPRQTEFSAGTIGLWGSDDFVIYYRNGRVPSPGIVVLGRIDGDATVFDTPGPVTIRVRTPGGASGRPPSNP